VTGARLLLEIVETATAGFRGEKNMIFSLLATTLQLVAINSVRGIYTPSLLTIIHHK